MPELPEVETIRRGLDPRIKGKTFFQVEIYDNYLIKYPSPQDFVEYLQGCTVSEVSRRGKYLIFSLSFNRKLALHLGMTGALIFPGEHFPKVSHLRILFQLDTGESIMYSDPRKFGGFWLLREGEGLEKLNSLGPDWWEKVTLPLFMEKISSRKNSRVKNLLMNQQLFSGMGNIYTDESLYRANILPFAYPGDLSEEQLKNLFYAIKGTLEEALKWGGTSTRDYLNSSGEPGGFQNRLLVYGRAGEKCTRCGWEIQKDKINGRGTYYCPFCQGET